MPATVLEARALLLDMDGTLVNSDAVVERCWRRWAIAQGLDPEATLKVVHGRQGYATMAALLPDRPMEQNYAENRIMLAEETADTDGVVPIGGAPAFMASIAGLPHALVTSADEALAQARMTAAALPVPETRVTAEMVGASKPDPRASSRARPSWASTRRTASCSRTPRRASRRAERPACASWASAPARRRSPPTPMSRT